MILQLNHSLRGHKTAITALRCFQNTIISGDELGNVFIWDESRRPILHAKVLDQSVLSIHVLENSNIIAQSRTELIVLDSSLTKLNGVTLNSMSFCSFDVGTNGILVPAPGGLVSATILLIA
jgi:hypothetical protein